MKSLYDQVPLALAHYSTFICKPVEHWNGEKLYTDCMSNRILVQVQMNRFKIALSGIQLAMDIEAAASLKNGRSNKFAFASVSH